MANKFKVLLVIFCVAALFGSLLQSRFESSLNLYDYHDDDYRYNAFFAHFYDDELLADDYIGDYIFSAMMPVIFKSFFYFIAQFTDPVFFASIVNLFLWPLMWVGVGFTAFRLGGVSVCIASLFLLFSVHPFFGQTGTPREFAMPALSIALLALVYGKVYVLAVIAALGSGIYPVITPVTGIILALYLLALPKKYQGKSADWGWRKRFLTLIIPFFIAVIFALPFFLAGEKYGGKTPVNEFAEAMPGGRIGGEYTPPYPSVYEALENGLRSSLLGRGENVIAQNLGLEIGWSNTATADIFEKLIPLIWFIIVAGCILKMKMDSSPYIRRFLLFFIAILITYFISVAVAPHFYHPNRFTAFTLPLFFIIIFPASIKWILESLFRAGSILKKHPDFKPYLVSFITVFLVIAHAEAFGGVRKEPPFAVEQGNREIISFLKTLPKNVTVAGWPVGLMEEVPYFAKRKILISREYHHPYHIDYVLEMRKRMRALVKAYFAADMDEIKRLRDDWQVDYLIVDFDILSAQKPPEYFNPFGKEVAAIWQANKDKGFALLHREDLQASYIYSHDNVYIMDLSRL